MMTALSFRFCLRPLLSLLPLSASLIALIANGPAFAQSVPNRAAPANGVVEQAATDADRNDDYHDANIVVITGHGLGASDILSNVTVLGGDNLARAARAQIGESLTRLPGLSATSFSPGASRPVIRGFQGERVRVLTDGIGAMDVSNTSADHAVTIDPLTAERIEVVRGPAVFLYGSQAIGGAVNVLDKRIPRRLTDEPAHVDVLATYGSAAQERSIGASLDMPVTSRVMWHIDGGHHRSDDVRSGGFVLSPDYRAALLHLADHDANDGLPATAEKRDMATRRGRIANSAARTTTANTGLAWFGKSGSIGGSIGYYETGYGVPERPDFNHPHTHDAVPSLPAGEEADDHGHDHGNVTIGMRQWRGDLRGEIRTDDGFLGSIRARAGIARYRHTEFEGGAVGTIFENEGAEARVEFVQNKRGDWTGTSGVQYMARALDAVGAEAFIPANITHQLGLFSVQNWTRGKVGIEAALRYERARVRDRVHGLRRTYDALSGALGLSWSPQADIRLGTNIARTARAPSAEELFSNGPHIATQAYEMGDARLKTERNWGGELYARIDNARYSLSLTAYANRFDSYVYEQATGARIDGLPVYLYRQQPASYRGIEGEGRLRLGTWRGAKINADTVIDFTRARIDPAGEPSANVPRIPPLRVLAGIEAQSNHLTLRLEAEHSAPQRKVAPLETPTAGFTLVNASATWHPLGNARNIALIFSGNNLFDVEARRAASFTKDYVPLSGRDMRATLRMSF